MRVGINATSLSERPSGARQRFVGLYGALFRAWPEHQFIVYEPRDCQVARWFAGLTNVSGVPTPLASGKRLQRFVRGLGYWQRQLRQDRIDLFESLHLPAVIAPNCPTILTVHDIRAGGGDQPQLGRALYRAVLRRSLRRAAAVVTVSDVMRSELIAEAPSARVVTIHNGINSAPFRAARGGARAIADKLQLPIDFVLAVGHFEPRKNYASLIEAMALIAPTRPGTIRRPPPSARTWWCISSG